MLEIIYACDLGFVALFFIFIRDLLMTSQFKEKNLRHITKKTLKSSRKRTLQYIAKSNGLPISKDSIILSRKELLDTLLSEKDKTRQPPPPPNPFSFNLTQPLLPPAKSITVKDLYNSSLACFLFNYKPTDSLSLKDLKQRFKSKYSEKVLASLYAYAYKSIKNNLNLLEGKDNNVDNLLLFCEDGSFYCGKKVDRVDKKVLARFSQDRTPLAQITSLGLTKYETSEDKFNNYQQEKESLIKEVKDSISRRQKSIEDIQALIAKISKSRGDTKDFLHTLDNALKP